SGTATAVLSPLSFQLSLSLNDPITLATNVAFENIYLMLEGGTASGMGGSAYATFDVDGIDVQVGVGYAAGVWSFSGKATNASTPPAGATGLPAGIAIGNLISSFSSTFGWTAPQALSSLVLT